MVEESSTSDTNAKVWEEHPRCLFLLNDREFRGV